VGLIPNPNDTFKKVDRTVDNVEVILTRTDETLNQVAATLTTVEGSLSSVGETLEDVRSLLTDLRGQLHLLQAVPALSEQLAEIHAVVTRRAPAS
jgi:ABC-type transporter Mla subunit MlaD